MVYAKPEKLLNTRNVKGRGEFINFSLFPSRGRGAFWLSPTGNTNCSLLLKIGVKLPRPHPLGSDRNWIIIGINPA